MSDQDLAKIKFEFKSHLHVFWDHMTTYESVDHEPKIWMCVFTPVKMDGTYGRAYTHYMFNDNIYRSKKKFLEAMTAWEEEQNTTP